MIANTPITNLAIPNNNNDNSTSSNRFTTCIFKRGRKNVSTAKQLALRSTVIVSNRYAALDETIEQGFDLRINLPNKKPKTIVPHVLAETPMPANWVERIPSGKKPVEYVKTTKGWTQAIKKTIQRRHKDMKNSTPVELKEIDYEEIRMFMKSYIDPSVAHVVEKVMPEQDKISLISSMYLKNSKALRTMNALMAKEKLTTVEHIRQLMILKVNTMILIAWLREKADCVPDETFTGLTKYFFRDIKYLMPITRIPRLNITKYIEKMSGSSATSSSTGMASSSITELMGKYIKNTLTDQIEKLVGPIRQYLSWSQWTIIISQFTSIILQLVHMSKYGTTKLLISSIVLGIVALGLTISNLLLTQKLDKETLTQFAFDAVQEMLLRNLNTDQDDEGLPDENHTGTTDNVFKKVHSWLDRIPSDFDKGSIRTKSEYAYTIRTGTDSKGFTNHFVAKQRSPSQAFTDNLSEYIKDIPISEPSRLGNSRSASVASMIDLKSTKSVSITSSQDRKNKIDDLRNTLGPRYQDPFGQREKFELTNPFAEENFKEQDPLPGLSEAVAKTFKKEKGLHNQILKTSLSTGSIINLVVGGLALSMTVAGIAGWTNAISLMKNYNISSTFKNNLNKNVTEIQDLVETTAEECFGLTLSRNVSYLNEVKDLILQLDRYIMMPIIDYQKNVTYYYEFKALIVKGTSLVTVGNHNTKPSANTANQMLANTLAQAKNKFASIMAGMTSNATRQETLLVHIVGEPGHGKTHFVNNYLIPQVAAQMGWSNSVYTINFAGQEKYWPIYNGSNIGIYDEFMAKKSACEIIPHINVIGSQGYMNFPHAELIHKTQPCNLKVLFLISNQPYINLRDILTSTAEKAFYSRFFRVHIDNTSYTSGTRREDIKHTPEYQELKFTHYPKPAGEDTQLTNSDSYVITKEEFVAQVTEKIRVFQNKFVPKHINSPPHLVDTPEIIKTSEQVDNVVFAFMGGPGSGKTTVASKVGTFVARTLKMPLFNITSEELNTVIVRTPSVIILNDRVTDEQAYLHFYDRIPKPSIIINTCNLSLGTSYLNFNAVEQKSIGFIESTICKIQNWLRPHTIIKGYRQTNQEPGFIRRVGAVGNLKHVGQVSYRNPQTGGVYVASPGFLFSKYGESEVCTVNEIASDIMAAFRLMYGACKGIELIENPNLVITRADVQLETESLDQLKEVVNSSKKCLSCFLEGLKENPNKPFIRISPKIRESSFPFAPAMFHIDNTSSIEGIKDLAVRSYSTLRQGNTDFTCSIAAGEDFSALAADGKIEFKTTKVTPFYYTHIIELDEMLIYKVYNDPNTPAELVASWDLKEVVDGMENGFRGMEFNNIQTEIFHYLQTNYDAISQTQAYQTWMPYVKVRQIVVQEEMDTRLDFVKAFCKFKESIWFKIVTIILSLIILLGVVSMTLNIFNFFKEKDTVKFDISNLPNVMQLPSGIANLKYTILGNRIHVKLSGTVSEEITLNELNEYINNFIPDKFSNLYVASLEVDTVVKQGDYTRDRTKSGKNKQVTKITDKSVEVHKPVVKSNANVLAEKVWGNMCLINVGYSVVHGIGIIGRNIVTPAHVWFSGEEIIDEGYCTREEKTRRIIDGVPHETITKVTHPVQLLCHNVDRDFAICRITDLSAKSFKKIIQYIPKEENIKDARQANYYIPDTRNGQYDRRTIETGALNCAMYRSSTGKEQEAHYSFQRWYGRAIKIRQGDCGSPLFSLDAKLDSTPFLGYLTGVTKDGFTVEGTVLTQENVNAALDRIDEVYGTNISKLNGQVTDGYKRLELEELHPETDNVEIYVSPDYIPWISQLEEANIEKDDIWYPNNQDSKLVPLGFHPKTQSAESDKHEYKEAEWMVDPVLAKKIEDMGIITAPSVISKTQLTEEQIAALPLVLGKPSLVGSQIMQYNDIIHWSPKHQEDLNYVINYLKPIFLKNYASVQHRPLTDLEVINGLYFQTRDPLYGHLEGLDLDTSAGHYAKTVLKETKKRPFFTRMENKTPSGKCIYNWASTDKARKMFTRVEITQDLAMSGVRNFSVVQDNLKREVTKKGKVRVFQSMDMSEIYLIRKYYGTTMAAIKKNHEEMPCQLGIDPIVEFNTLFDRFSKISLHGEAGDFKRWDKHMTAPLVRAGVELMTTIATNGGNDPLGIYANIQKVVTSYILCAICICDKVVYQKFTGNPSGNVLTTPLNSIVNDIYHVWFIKWSIEKVLTTIRKGREAFEAAYPEKRYSEAEREVKNWPNLTAMIERIDKDTDHASYGDDYVQVIDPKWHWMVNFEERKEFFKTVLNIEYDTPEKDGKSYKIKPLQELSFLSRLFTKGRDGLVYPRLKTESIISSLKWTKNDIPEIVAQSLQDCLNEAALYDKKFYDQVSDIVRDIEKYYIRKRDRGFIFPIPTYDLIRVKTQEIIRYKRSAVELYPEDPQKVIVRIDTTVANAVVPTINSVRSSRTLRNLLILDDTKIIKTSLTTPRIKMSTGTAEVSAVMNSRSGEGEPITTMESGLGHINTANVKQQLYRADAKEQAFSKFWVKNLVIPMNSEAGTTIAVIPYMDKNWMSTPMLAWASLHSLTNVTIRYEFQFITAGTVVNCVLVGMAEVYDAPESYTIEKLQLLEWETTSVNSDRRAVYLNFATPLTSFAGSAVGALTTGVDPNIAPKVGDFIPTLVLKTLTTVQNSFANDQVSVNMAVFAQFVPNGNGPNFYYRIKDMTSSASNSIAGDEVAGVKNYRGATLSTLLRMDPNKPFYITCDGSVDALYDTEGMLPGYAGKLDIDYYIHNAGVQKNAGDDDPVFPQVGAMFGNRIQIPIHVGMTLENEYGEHIKVSMHAQRFLFILGIQGRLDSDESRSAMAAILGSEDAGKLMFYYRGETQEAQRNMMWRALKTHLLARSKYDAVLVRISGADIIQSVTVTEPTEDSALAAITDKALGYILSSVGTNTNIMVEDMADTAPYRRFYNTIVANPSNEQLANVNNTRRIIMEEWAERSQAYTHTRDNEVALRIITASNNQTGETGIYMLIVSKNSPDINVNDTGHAAEFNGSIVWQNPAPTIPQPNFLDFAYDLREDIRYSVELPSNLVKRITDIQAKGTLTIDPQMSILEFANTLPPTITNVLAESGSRTTIRDPEFLVRWRSLLRHLNYDCSTQNVRFTLSNTIQALPMATVMYHGDKDIFVLMNVPTQPEHTYRTYPKVIAEETIISNLQLVPRGLPLVGKTDTTRWISRVVATYDDERVFNGQALSKNFNLTDVKIRISSRLKTGAKFAETPVDNNRSLLWKALSTQDIQLCSITRVKCGGMMSVAQVAGGAASGAGQGLAQWAQSQEYYKQMNAKQREELDAAMARLESGQAHEKDMALINQAWQEGMQASAQGHETSLSVLKHQQDIEKLYEADRLKSGYTGIAQQQRNNIAFEYGGLQNPDGRTFDLTTGARNVTPASSESSLDSVKQPDSVPEFASTSDAQSTVGRQWDIANARNPLLAATPQKLQPRTPSGNWPSQSGLRKMNGLGGPGETFTNGRGALLSDGGSITPRPIFKMMYRQGVEPKAEEERQRATEVLKVVIEHMIRDRKTKVLTRIHGHPAIKSYTHGKEVISVGFVDTNLYFQHLQSDCASIAEKVNNILTTLKIKFSNSANLMIKVDHWKTITQVEFVLEEKELDIIFKE